MHVFQWPILFSVYLASVDVKGPLGLTLTVAFVAPLQGFTNFLVFVRPRLMKRWSDRYGSGNSSTGAWSAFALLKSAIGRRFASTMADESESKHQNEILHSSMDPSAALAQERRGVSNQEESSDSPLQLATVQEEILVPAVQSHSSASFCDESSDLELEVAVAEVESFGMRVSNDPDHLCGDTGGDSSIQESGEEVKDELQVGPAQEVGKHALASHHEVDQAELLGDRQATGNGTNSFSDEVEQADVLEGPQDTGSIASVNDELDHVSFMENNAETDNSALMINEEDQAVSLEEDTQEIGSSSSLSHVEVDQGVSLEETISSWASRRNEFKEAEQALPLYPMRVDSDQGNWSKYLVGNSTA